MSRHYGKKADANQPDIVECLRQLGATIQHTHQVEGALDLIIGYAGIDQRVEIKNPEFPPSARKLTTAEQEVFYTWKGRPPVILETEQDCVDLIVRMRGCQKKK